MIANVELISFANWLMASLIYQQNVKQMAAGQRYLNPIKEQLLLSIGKR